MLFKDEYFKSEFDFGSDLVLELPEEPESQLRDAIMSTIEKLEKAIEDNENQKILLYHPIEAADLNSITIPDKTFTKKEILNQINRTEDDRIQGIIRRFGVTKPDRRNERDYKLYLKLEYFIFFVRYYVFPRQKFYDLYIDKNRSSENIAFGNGENSKYGDFLLSNISDEIVYNRFKQKEDDWYRYSYLTFKKFVEVSSVLIKIVDAGGAMDKIIEPIGNVCVEEIEAIEKKYKNSEDVPMQEFLNIFTDLFGKYLTKKIDDILKAGIHFKNNIYDKNPLYDFVNYVVIFDYIAYVEDTKKYKGKSNLKKVLESMPRVTKSIRMEMVCSDKIYEFVESEKCLDVLYGTSQSLEKRREMIEKTNIINILEEIFDITESVEESIEEDGDSIFLKNSDGKKYLTGETVILAIWTILNISDDEIYYSKNTNLKDRNLSLNYSERKLKNEINYYKVNGKWRNNKQMPILVYEILITKILKNTLLTISDEEDMMFQNFYLRFLRTSNLIIMEKLAYTPIIERYYYLKKLIDILNKDAGYV